MLQDICYCPVSLNDPDAVQSWNGLVLAILSHGQSAPIHLEQLLKQAPDFAMAHATKGLSALMLGRKELVDVAKAASKEASRCLSLGSATKREQLWCSALEDWLKGKPSHSILRMEEALRLNPADTISMKISHAIRFILGDNVGMLQSVEAVIDAHGEDHGLRGYALGCLSFAQEETGDYVKAEKSGLLSMDYVDDDAWGLHAVTHVYDMTHRPKDGISLIENNRGAWSDCNNFRFHVWWHKALLHLDQGEIDEVFSLYDAKIRDEKTDDYRDFSNASSLLMRLELEGCNVGDRWVELADLAEKRSDDGCLVFADLHYMLALNGDKRRNATTRMLARVAEDAKGQSDVSRIMDDPGVCASEGLAAFGEAQFDVAFRKLFAARGKFQSMGGSHAQRDVFERVTIEAGIRAGQLKLTESLIDERTRLRGGHLDTYTLSRLNAIAEIRSMKLHTAAE